MIAADDNDNLQLDNPYGSVSSREDYERLHANTENAINETLSDNDDDDDSEEFISGSEDETTQKLFTVKKSTIKLDDGEDIDSFMQNKTKVHAFIKAYQKQDELWDTTRPPRLVNRCKKKRLQCCEMICKELAENQILLTTGDVEKCIKYIRVRYIRDVRIRYKQKQNKDKDYKPLWFYEALEFLRPTFRFVKEVGF